jgi:hypothetical protein
VSLKAAECNQRLQKLARHPAPKFYEISPRI